MGILDYLTGNDPAASPYGALYQAPDADAQAAALKKQQDEQAQANFLRGLMENPTEGVGNINPNAGPSAIVSPKPDAPPSIFGPTPQIAAPAAPQGFGAGATPFGFAGPGSMTGVSPAMMAPQTAPAPVPAAQPPAVVPPAVAAAAPSADDNDPIAVGSYQMPRVGSGFPDDDEETPAAATPTSGKGAPNAPASAGPAPFSLGGAADGIGDRLMKGTKGFLGNLQNGPIGAVAGGLGALITGRSTDPSSIASEHGNATAQALIAKGAAPADVAAAKDNPELMKALIGQYYGKDKWKVVKTGQDAFGGETYQQQNQEDGTFKPIPGNEGGASGSTGGMLAPGVKAVDSTLKGDDYLKQFSPEVQAAVQDYKDGKATPTGNPRKGFTQIVKMVAQKYGADTGQQIDDTTYSARRTMRNQLSSSAPSSLGGQINIGNTAAGHLADLSQKAVELGNVDWGIAPLSAAVNNVRGLGTEQAAKMEALKGAAQHYGQEITKFYAGSPGGTAERDRFIESVNGARSPKELAAILETEGQLMHSRLDALGGQIQGVLGDDGMKQYPVLRPDGQAGLDKVSANVARLRGGGTIPGTAGAATISEGATATNPQTGQTITFRGGKWQ